jgi:adenylylsulfate kinase
MNYFIGNMGSTPQRSFLKGMIWEIISFIIATLAIYLFYGDLGQSLRFSLALTAIKVPLFFIHERIWKKIKWGKC